MVSLAVGRSSGREEVCQMRACPAGRIAAHLALLHIGDLAAAERTLTSGLSTLDTQATRDRTLYLVRLAELQHQAGRLDEATATAQAASQTAEDLTSARVRNSVRRLQTTLLAAG
jgi:ATP/maltotriose-dependent transcriptional regulator MalT